MSLRTPHRLLLIAGAASALALVPVAANAGTAPVQYTTIDVPGAVSTVAVGVNDSGVVSGFYFDSSGNEHGFVDRDGRFTAINDPNAGTAAGQGTSVGYINDFGEVTGSYTESNGDTVAFAGPVGTFRPISDPVAPAFSTLTAAINDAGVVVGGWVDSGAEFHGFIEVHGGFIPVEDPAGTEGTNVAGISNLGVIVGFYVDSSGNFHGFELSPAH
jgi:hypothetical protein